MRRQIQAVDMRGLGQAAADAAYPAVAARTAKPIHGVGGSSGRPGVIHQALLGLLELGVAERAAGMQVVELGKFVGQ
jgi:hypothetical protein